MFYEPETLTAYEIAFKTRVPGNAGRLNGSYFHYDYTNLPLSQLTLIAGAPTQRTLNAGQAKIDGVELESVITPARNHQFDVSATWLNARYTDYLVDAVGPLFAQFAGRKLDRSPGWTVSAAYDWRIPLANFGAGFDDGVAQLTDPRLYGVRVGTRFRTSRAGPRLPVTAVRPLPDGAIGRRRRTTVPPESSRENPDRHISAPDVRHGGHGAARTGFGGRAGDRSDGAASDRAR
ncbi:TonB-dependent receptor domain-containing protein [Sphingomonas sp. CFBP 8760]|uniref:TonB-dependent receptor domain-containing protein n=1 Tax=Sphingomonas sp. CFBP 8760 TaxID=2775282 RepID=UPI001FCEBEC1|nr:TonB-dependent receptor [Sphingomonas sp. CFBP 8760]